MKQRLVGAVVLLAIAVLFLPSLLNREGRRPVDLTSQLPSEPVRVIDMPEVAEPERPDNIPAAKPWQDNYPHQPAGTGREEQPPAADTSAVSTDPDVAAAPDAGADPDIAAPQVATPHVTAPHVAGNAEKPALNSQGVPDAWSLQVASFQSDERAQALLQRLREAGYKSYVVKATTAEGQVHRVFVGPKINRAAAESEKRSIDKRFNTDALLVEFNP